ncbi:hypothetical protein [Pectobacterium polaris]|uniref:hypothetical protein n=1 Tax=Pectobacterium polaris TaxID=2042057 RepID=UPI0020BE2FD3|nr:hypothetical protein [Pectobacterium polaris]
MITKVMPSQCQDVTGRRVLIKEDERTAIGPYYVTCMIYFTDDRIIIILNFRIQRNKALIDMAESQFYFRESSEGKEHG